MNSVICASFAVLFYLLICHHANCENQGENIESSSDHQINKKWVVRIVGGQRAAKQLARKFGYFYEGPVRNFQNTYILLEVEHLQHDKRGEAANRSLSEDATVVWAEKQVAKKREKRDSINLFEIMENEVYGESFRNWLFKQRQKENKAYFNDELWSQEWYMQDTRAAENTPKLDLNVLPVYKANITGRNVRVTILDDGLEYTHEDLWRNYDPEISWDCNEEDDDPMPRYDRNMRNSHGTRCAGEVAMTANNGKCGVGIAYDAKIGGVKLLDGYVNDLIEGIALGFAWDKVDIYSASWGPSDDGRTLDGPGTLAKEAIRKGIKWGRQGKGSIYVWASGNGGSRGDNCNCDGYLASPYTISIGSASQSGEFPWYGEACASTLAVTYSSGAYSDQMIATTDLNNRCTIKHTGTSASAPLAAGIIALALEANPNLTWRDVQHVIVYSSDVTPVFKASGWQRNGANLWFNTKFGFGLMNAYKLVTMATNWITVPPKWVCKINGFKQRSEISIDRPAVVQFFVQQRVNYLEHVEVQVNIKHPIRGVLAIDLISPSGTKVKLLEPRKYDVSSEGFRKWSFMSVMTWGENPNGAWLLNITDTGTKVMKTRMITVLSIEDQIGYLGNFSLILHGTVEPVKGYVTSTENYLNDRIWKIDNVCKPGL